MLLGHEWRRGIPLALWDFTGANGNEGDGVGAGSHQKKKKKDSGWTIIVFAMLK